MDIGSASHVVRFDPDYQTIHQFIEEWKPVIVPAQHVEWIIVSAHFADKFDSVVNTTSLAEARESLCLSSLERLTNADIEHLAIVHNILHGKWMIFLDKDKVDEEWARIALGVVKGDLAPDTKVSTAHVKLSKYNLPKEEKIPLGKHLICVWSTNFIYVKDVFSLWARLLDLGFQDSLLYKPNAYSICGVYTGNSLGLFALKFHA